MKRASCLGLRFLIILSFVFTLLIQSSEEWANADTSGTPTSFKVTVTKVEMHNGTSYVEIWSGTSEIDLSTGGTFDGIDNITLPAGTYSLIRVTIKNAFPVKGNITDLGTPYYTTAATAAGGTTGLASAATTTAGDVAYYTFYNPLWGALDDSKTLDEQAINPSVVVVFGVSWIPTLRFTLTNKLNFITLGTYFTISAPDVTIIMP
ncbi:MAG: hypothetical protein HQ552_10425 [Desulfobacteraceae bacterium]|nr:hypothetical protein [Desulfobacteraceae bacterium]